MMERITVTPEMLEGARDYVPDREKMTWVTENAAKCFDKLAITADDEPLPPMFMVNEGLKRRYLMAALVGLYLRRAFDPDVTDAALMSEEDYDKWAGSHVFEQINRMKHTTALRDKCFDIISDYKDLEKRFYAQISALLSVQNDYVLRQGQYTAAQMKELPQVLQALQSYQTAQGDGLNGG